MARLRQARKPPVNAGVVAEETPSVVTAKPKSVTPGAAKTKTTGVRKRVLKAMAPVV